ncbi:MAG TPA: SRPBCC family protein [Chroococcales cyanobacterium]
MTSTEFVYTTFIKTTQQKVWDAITNAEFTRQYWGCAMNSDWKKGSHWQMISNPDGRTNMVGEVLESSPITRLAYSWHRPDTNSKSDTSRVTFQLETVKDAVKLTVVHDKLAQGSEMAKGVSQGWPLVLSSLKSFLETGDTLDFWAIITTDCAADESGKVKIAR